MTKYRFFKNLFSFPLVLSIARTIVPAMLLYSCSEALDDTVILKPNGTVASYKELSAGTSTIFSSSSRAYDTEANWVTGDLETMFTNGDMLSFYRRIRTGIWRLFLRKLS